jgi:cytochrome c oxidase subunit 4
VSDSHAKEHAHDDLGHVAPKRVLLGTFGALMTLTVLTVTATRIDMGANLNLILAMVIATVKASLVCAFFMHLKYEKRFLKGLLLLTLSALTLFIGMTFVDVWYR